MKRMLAVAIGAALLSAGTAHAQWVTLNGAGFDVVYDDSLVGLFGAPTLSGNGRTIIFTPTGFIAESSDALGTIIQSQTVNFNLKPTAGKRISTVNVRERGDYKIVDANPGQSGANLDPAVDVSGEIRLTNLFNGVSQVTSVLTKVGPLNVTCPDISCAPTQWLANAAVAAPISWSDGLDPLQSPATGAPNVRFQLQDVLTAQSFLLGDSAFIQKKLASSTISIDVDIDPDISMVPIPATLPLLASALAGFLGLGRRRA